MVSIGVIQMRSEPLKVYENLLKAEYAISEVARGGANIVVLPEMFSVGFSTDLRLMGLGESLDGYTITWLKNQAEKHNVYIITSVYESNDGHFYNTMVMVGSDRSLQIYRKRNPTCQERLVWERFEKPGPGIFETPYGRIGGAICFDSFTRETFEGFQKSRVAIVIVIALWGTIVPMSRYPDTIYFNKLLRHQSKRASETVPKNYVRALGIPVVYVNQCGRICFPVKHPRAYPFPEWSDSLYEFYGNSNVYDKSGRGLIDDVNLTANEFCLVRNVDLCQVNSLPQISKVNIPAAYMDREYYFVDPPFTFKLYQKLCFDGFKKEYEVARQKENHV